MVMKVKTDTKKLDRQIQRHAKTLDRAVVRGLNSTAFEARKKAPAIIKKQIDKQSPTLNVRQGTTIRKATIDDQSATLKIGGAQGKILARQEFGFVADFVQMPGRKSKKSTDKYGNVKKELRPFVSGIANPYFHGPVITDNRSMKFRAFKELNKNYKLNQVNTNLSARRQRAQLRYMKKREERDAQDRKKLNTNKGGRKYREQRPEYHEFFYVGERGHFRLSPGVYRRYDGNGGIEMMTAFQSSKRYGAKLKIREELSERLQLDLRDFIIESLKFRAAKAKSKGQKKK